VSSLADEAGRQLVADARAQSVSERATAMAARLASVEIEKESIMATGRAEAERIDRAAAEQVPGWAEELVAQIMTLPVAWGRPDSVAEDGKPRPYPRGRMNCQAETSFHERGLDRRRGAGPGPVPSQDPARLSPRPGGFVDRFYLDQRGCG
jgi:hypothetical protein